MSWKSGIVMMLVLISSGANARGMSQKAREIRTGQINSLLVEIEKDAKKVLRDPSQDESFVNMLGCGIKDKEEIIITTSEEKKFSYKYEADDPSVIPESTFDLLKSKAWSQGYRSCLNRFTYRTEKKNFFMKEDKHYLEGICYKNTYSKKNLSETGRVANVCSQLKSCQQTIFYLAKDGLSRLNMDVIEKILAEVKSQYGCEGFRPPIQDKEFDYDDESF